MTITDQLTNSQLVSNADEQMAHIQRQMAEIAKQVHGYEAELGSIHKGQDMRLTELQTTRADVATKQGAHEQALTIAKLSIDTPNEAVSTKNASSAKKALQTAQKQLVQLETQDSEAKQNEQARENELLDAINKTRVEQARLAQEQHSIETVRTQAMRQIAEHRYTTHIQTDSEHERRIDELKGQLVEAQAERLEAHEQVLQELEGYPDLQRAIKERRPLDNPTTRMFETTLQYMDTFMADARNIEEYAKLPSLRNAMGSYPGLWNYLYVQQGELINFLQRPPGANPPATLPATRERLQKLLDEYREWKRKHD